MSNALISKLSSHEFPAPSPANAASAKAHVGREGADASATADPYANRRHYRQPVSYIRHGHTLLRPGGGRGTANVPAATSVRLIIDGRQHKAWPEVIDAPHAVEELLLEIRAASPAFERFVPIHQQPDGHL